MENTIKVTVGMLTYNQENYVKDAIESIFNQTYPIDEFIISDDHSSDNTLSVVKETVKKCQEQPHKIQKIIISTNKINLGIAEHFNLLINKCSNYFFITNSGDDISKKKRIEICVEEYKKRGSPKYFLCHSDVEVINDSIIFPPPIASFSTDASVVATKFALHIGATQAFTLDLYKDFGPILRDTYEDLILGFRAALVGDYHYIKQPLLRYRKGGISSPERTTLEKTKELIKETILQRVSDAFLCGRRDLISLMFDFFSAHSLGEIHKDIAALEISNEYTLWQKKHSIEPIHAQIYAEHMMAWPRRPRFTLIVPTHRENLAQLADTLSAMENQLYKEWQLIVVADYEAPSPLFLQSDTLGWLQIDDLNDDQQLASAYNGLLDLGCDWIGILPPGSELAPHAFLALGDYAQAHPHWSAIYTDHDHKDEQGQYVQPWFKPDFNLDYLRSMDYVGAALWFKGEALQRLGGFQPFPGAWLYDALLRLLDGEGEEAIGHIAEPLHHFPAQRQPHPLTQASRQVALENHLQRRGTAAQITAGLVPDTFQVLYQRPDTPLVSIIIPNRDFVWFLRPCLESLFAKTDYGNYEVVIVDNQTEDPDTLAYYQQLQATQGERVRIVPYDQPFNFSAQCNLGVAQARGEYVVLLNNDTEIVQGSWLTRMVSHLARPEVGIVGARLVFPEAGGIQHAGVILGMDQVASHAFMGLSLQDAGYMNRLQVEQNYSAVTGACLLIRKSTYKAVGGLNEENTPVLFNDIDLCLKVASVGQLIVWTPYATLIHHANVSINTSVEALKAKAASLERNALSAKFMHQRWKDFLRNDPAYNRHLALHTNKSFHVEEELVADWDANFQDRLKVLALPPAGGVGEYRFYAPLRALTDSAQLQSTIIQTKTYHKQRYLTLSEMERLGPDVLMAQVDYSPMFHDWLERYREMLPKLRINLMIDDLITEMPRDNPNFKRIPRDGRYRLRKLFKLADSVIVSTQPLLDLVSELTDKGVLVPNTLRDELWLPLQSRKRTGPKPRVGWAGAQQHQGDLAIIANVVKRTASQVDWVFFGMCPEEIRPYIAEFHDFVVGVETYPAKLASLNLDLAVAPLEQHPFNQAKSNLRILEYGILGLPVICTDIYPYRTDDAPVTRVPNEEQAWVEAILERVNHPDQAEREGAALKQWVQRHYLLSQVQDLWFQAITGPRA